MDNLPRAGVRFAISPAGERWAWQAFDLQGGIINQGEAKSKREAAAFIIRETLRSCALVSESAPFEALRAAA